MPQQHILNLTTEGAIEKAAAMAIDASMDAHGYAVPAADAYIFITGMMMDSPNDEDFALLDFLPEVMPMAFAVEYNRKSDERRCE